MQEQALERDAEEYAMRTAQIALRITDTAEKVIAMKAARA